MTRAELFRRRNLQCHDSLNVVNDRSSYEVRHVSELDALGAVGSVVDARGGHGVTRFAHCAETRTKWLGTIERALLERHLSRLLQFSPSLESTRTHFHRNGPSKEESAVEVLDGYRELVHRTVFALITQSCRDKELREIVARPELLVGLLSCARRRALPLLVAWLLDENDRCGNGEAAGFYRLALHKIELEQMHKLKQTVRNELLTTRTFVTEFVRRLANQRANGVVAMATHIPEAFVREGEKSDFSCGHLFDSEIDQLWRTHSVACGDKAGVGGSRDLVDPSLRCRAYNDPDESEREATPIEVNPHARAPVFVSSSMPSQPVECQRRKQVEKYQWLPTDVQVGVDGSVALLSPLHASVHPRQFPVLYELFPQVLRELLPLFERVLTNIKERNPPPPLRIGLGSTTRNSPSLMVQAAAFPQCAEPVSLRGRHIQVITKLTTIRLDAAQPIFTPESHCNLGWELDGDDHEHIVAVGYHVLRARNTTPAKLAFRAFAHCPSTVEEGGGLSSQEDVFLAFGERTSGFYGGRYGRQFLQPWGSLALHEQRSIAVPGFLTHRLEPFELLDAADSDGGELMIATFYLVDPSRAPIVSTRTVRAEEWQQARSFVQANVDMLRDDPGARYFPDEIASRIEGFAASSVSDAEARLVRERLLRYRRRQQELRFVTPSLRLEELRLALSLSE